jgi:NADPH-dependent 2,4-dienoyl-CoA reductase/sulfur reductase-like enzyme
MYGTLEYPTKNLIPDNLLLSKNIGVIGCFSTIIGDLALGVAGLTERLAKELGFNFVVGMSVAPDKHPGVMPGCKEMRVKLLFEKDSKILIGGQIAGGVTTGEVTNIIASLGGEENYS